MTTPLNNFWRNFPVNRFKSVYTPGGSRCSRRRDLIRYGEQKALEKIQEKRKASHEETPSEEFLEPMEMEVQ